MEEFETIEVESSDGVTIVRLARPPVNAVNRQMMTELTRCFRALADDREIGAIVLSAKGERAFCGGIDLKEVGQLVDAPDRPVQEVLDEGSKWRNTQHAIRHVPVPVVAAIDGPAIGAGFGLAGVVDIIIASERARFGLTEINVGLLGGSSKAMRMLGPYKARMMFFSGELVPASELYRLGAVEEIVPNGAAETRAVDVARMFATKSPIGLRLAKESILRIEDMPMEDAYRTEQDYTARLRGLNDSREAREAFFEHRAPVWTWS